MATPPQPPRLRPIRSQLTSVEPPPISISRREGNVGIEQVLAARHREPRLLGRRDDLEAKAGALPRPSSRKSSPLQARRQASVAMWRARVTRLRSILAAQTSSALKVRSMASPHSTPLSATPSPSRTGRE